MLLDEMKKSSTILNTKGGMYYATTYDSNLDLFAGISRMDDESKLRSLFNAAYSESRALALENLLYILDIRKGKGERRIFNILFSELIEINECDATLVLSLIGNLGRWDYTLTAMHSKIEDKLIMLLKHRLALDLASDYPSLLGKWLPSIRCHGKTNMEAIYLLKRLGYNEKEYREVLKSLREKIRIVESIITNKDYSKLDYEAIPAKAMLRYNNLFNLKDSEAFNSYKASLKENEVKLNTKGLYPYEIVKRCFSTNLDKSMLDLMWKNQERVFESDKNILVMADTSGSMTCYGGLPLYASLGLAIYTAENNTGAFKNAFISFSSDPRVEILRGRTIYDIVHNIKEINTSTDIDKAFKMLLDAAVRTRISASDMPSHIIIISDMEFDDGVYSKGGTNLSGWRVAFNDAGYNLPKIVFWNVAARTNGLPATKFDNDIVMVSGFSTCILKSLLNLEDYNPASEMLEVLKRYEKYIQ